MILFSQKFFYRLFPFLCISIHPMKVILAANISDSFSAFLLAHNCRLSTDYTNPIAIAEAQGIVTSTKLIIDAAFLAKAPQLKWIARLGSGMEIIDVELCKQKNIFCCNSPAGIANAVAEHSVAMLIGLQKNIISSAQQVQQHQWIREPNRGWELQGKTIGIIGFGHTGAAFAHKLSVFDCTVLAFDPYKTITHQTAQSATLQQIYQQADVVSYHVPYNAQTDNYYHANQFAKPHILINTSRGGIAHTSAILKGFAQGNLIAACLDVLDFEQQLPFSEESKNLLDQLYRHPCIITPHIAGYSHNAIQKMCAELQQQLQSTIFHE
jgi:D-3-phosphoglycerate dehydrogenase / 2-oxoglutarate reductase